MDEASLKYRTLIRQLRRIAAEHDCSLVFVREGSNHELWEIDGRRLTIQRHREINERTARAIVERAREVATDDN